MKRSKRQDLQVALVDLANWSEQARVIDAFRRRIVADADAVVEDITKSAVELKDRGSIAWTCIPLNEPDTWLEALIRRSKLYQVSDADWQGIPQLLDWLPETAITAQELLSTKRLFIGRERRKEVTDAARFALQFHEWAVATDLPGRLRRMEQTEIVVAPQELTIEFLTSPEAEVEQALAACKFDPTLLATSDLGSLAVATRLVTDTVDSARKFKGAALDAGKNIRVNEAQALLKTIPVDRLKSVTTGRLTLSPLVDAGYKTVQDILAYETSIQRVPGISSENARRVIAAAYTVRRTVIDEMPVRIDIQARTVQTAALLHGIHAWETSRLAERERDAIQAARMLTPLANLLDLDFTHILLLPNKPVEQLQQRRSQVLALAAWVDERMPYEDSWEEETWEDFLKRPADYFALLSELGIITEDEEAAQGSLPNEIVESIRGFELDNRYLTASLRGYQSFGARFALVQQKVIIGDEMGLGKTIEALAVIAHLRARGVQHFLVICPAAIVTNWMREIASKSELAAHRLHGSNRASALRNWKRGGDVGVTTYETLPWLTRPAHGVEEIGCVVVDEAHYIKNPEAQRTQRTSHLVEASDHAILLTGTPLENHVDEFRNLVRYVQPDLRIDASDFAPRRFRTQVAPAYLRRNQEDVLTELPDLVEVMEWLPMTKEDGVTYRAAVADGNFMAMRRAAFASLHSEKLKRLVEIVEEARENNRRVIVFSYFKETLAFVAAALGESAYGPLTGSVPAERRQDLLDRFSAAPHGATLIAQISVGGVGLNIQSASVVIICEPQLKPTAEWQAIARSRRMGQLETVQVHRLLSDEGVDPRIVEILAEKSQKFSDFARHSETADSAPEAFDISDAQLARDVIAAERERLHSQPAQTSDAEQSS